MKIILLAIAIIGIISITTGYSQNPKQTKDSNTPPTPPSQYYLSDALFSDDELITWLKNSLTTTFAISYKNYHQELANSRQFFTTKGYNDLLNLLEQEQILDAIVQKKLDTKLYFDNPLKIDKKRVIAHKYTWELNTTLTLFFQGDSQAFSQDVPIKIIVTRATPNTGVGILISDITLS